MKDDAQKKPGEAATSDADHAPFYLKFSARYIPMLAGFCESEEWTGTWVDAFHFFPAPDESGKGVIGAASNGHIACLAFDPAAVLDRPISLLLPARIVDACRYPASTLMTLEGDGFPVPPPLYLCPHEFVAFTSGAWVTTKTAQPGFHSQLVLSSAIAVDSGIWQPDDYRVLEPNAKSYPLGCAAIQRLAERIRLDATSKPAEHSWLRVNSKYLAAMHAITEALGAEWSAQISEPWATLDIQIIEMPHAKAQALIATSPDDPNVMMIAATHPRPEPQALPAWLARLGQGSHDSNRQEPSA